MLRASQVALVTAIAIGSWIPPLGVPGIGGGAVAQTAAPAPGAAGGSPSGQAPVGHRQPRPSALPPETDRQKKADEREDEEQRRLDRVLRNICRGC